MAPPSVTKNKRRRKRRTEDFSSDSDSSSLSDNEAPEKTQSQDEPVQGQAQILIDNMDIQSDTESHENEPEALPKDIESKVQSIKFTTTETQSASDARETVQRDRQQLDSEFLAYMATTHSDDLDELRKKADFTDRSIVMLAKTLQLGSNMFDSETLEALLRQE